MLRSWLAVLALALTFALPSARADAPTAERFEMSSHERATLREAIRSLKELLRQVDQELARHKICFIRKDVEETQRAARRLLWQLEWAYANHLPSPVKIPNSTSGTRP